MFETESFSCSSKDSNKPSQDKNEWITTRQCSCAFVNTPLPCINKAIHHIQELELKVEKCFQQSDCVFKEDKIPWTTKQVSAESIQDIWLSLSTKLDFKEADVCCEDGKTLTLKQETEALLLEVTELIRRLEADCEEAEKALELEKQRRKKLGMKIDCMSLWRLQQLPAAVQKEYQMCAQDILELQWHIDCKSRQLRQVQNQILKIETVNRKIQEDIDFMKKHSPLLEEKLNLESEAVKDVLLAYEKTSKIYGDVHCELMEIQKTMKSIDEESEKKIKSMYEKITYAEVLLSQYMNELKHSEFIWTEYCMKLKETEKKIIKDEKHLEELVKQKAEIQEDAKCWNSKNSEWNLKKEIQDQKGVWKVIQTRIKAIYEELEKKKKDRLKKREEDMKRIEEIERQVADLETKLKINKDILQDNHEKLSYLDQREQELYKQQKRTEQQLEQKRSIMQQQLNDIQEKISFVSSQIFENFHTMEKFKNELKELNELWNIKQIQMENTEKSFIDLRKNLSGVMFKQQNVQMIFNHLQDELAEYEKRLKQEEKTYGELLQIRKENLKDLEAALEQIIKENLWLAQEYQIFQNYYLNSKEDLTELYANRIRVEAAIRDHQQLRALQRRLRRALVARWRRHGLSIQAGLARIQAASQENAQKILAVQGELSKAIQHITTFLRSLTDGSPTTDNNANNQCILDAEIKDKKSHTVQITV
ncbi:coiled-coil domain-containing protein 178 isoform X5 [Balearica regulorum gibbericeps]|uniref:coiled-coil domain-containing protein 178 isoform X5 n=1 Tax=Balearica regulorum gibbericeps TaxID=100784 RepID=UPI003F60A328